jgi:hypothetical protein
VEVPGAGGSTTLLDEGKLIFDYTYNKSWNEDYCKGGFAWSLTSQNYKNCVTSQLGILAASKLARLMQDVSRGAEVCGCKAQESYHAIALRTAGWLLAAPMRNSTSQLYNDGLYCSAHNTSAGRTTQCTNDNGPTWTYCTVPVFEQNFHSRMLWIPRLLA